MSETKRVKRTPLRYSNPNQTPSHTLTKRWMIFLSVGDSRYLPDMVRGDKGQSLPLQKYLFSGQCTTPATQHTHIRSWLGALAVMLVPHGPVFLVILTGMLWPEFLSHRMEPTLMGSQFCCPGIIIICELWGSGWHLLDEPNSQSCRESKFF